MEEGSQLSNKPLFSKKKVLLVTTSLLIFSFLSFWWYYFIDKYKQSKERERKLLKEIEQIREKIDNDTLSNGLFVPTAFKDSL